MTSLGLGLSLPFEEIPPLPPSPLFHVSLSSARLGLLLVPVSDSMHSIGVDRRLGHVVHVVLVVARVVGFVAEDGRARVALARRDGVLRGEEYRHHVLGGEEGAEGGSVMHLDVVH